MKSGRDHRQASVRTERHYLGVSKFVLSVVYVNGRQQLLAGFLAVNELSLRDGTGIQHSVSAIADTETVTDH